MDKSEHINELATALAKAQAVMHPVKKAAENPFFKSSYADLAGVFNAVQGPLAANGLAVCQTFANGADGSTVTITTTLLHASGQWISGELTLRPVKADPQGIGSACTYGRRYSLMAICGLPAENDDDDGNAATHAAPAKPVPVPPAKKSDGRIAVKDMALKLMGTPDKAKEYLLDYFGCSVDDLDPVKDRAKLASAYTAIDAELKKRAS